MRDSKADREYREAVINPAMERCSDRHGPALREAHAAMEAAHESYRAAWKAEVAPLWGELEARQATRRQARRERGHSQTEATA
jgi:hypothetical protein